MTSPRLPARSPRRLIAGVVLSLNAVTGCQSMPHGGSKSPSVNVVAPEPTLSDQDTRVRDAVLHDRPDALVGTVVDTMMSAPDPTGVAPPAPDLSRPYTAVGHVRMQDVQVDQKVSFLDGNGQLVTSGAVVRIEGDLVFVRYDPAGPRAPMKGDTAVWAK